MLSAVLSFLVLGLFIAAVLSYLASLAWPALRRGTAMARPASRVLFYLVYAFLPPLSAALTALLVMHPELSGVLVPEHCHGSNCDVHQPVFLIMHPAGAALAATSVLVIIALVFAAQRAIRRGRRLLRMLAQLSDETPVLDYALVPSSDAIAWCAGLLRPRVYLSTALEALFSDRDLQIVLAHEHAHARRRDNLRHLLVSWATMAWRRRQRRDFLEHYAECTEAACDSVAAAHVGSARAVIDLIERLPELSAEFATDRRMAFDASDRSFRVNALSLPKAGAHPLTTAWLVLGVLWLGAPTLLTGPGHYLLEWLTTL
ncbi:MAG: M48 family metalloprotease [Pseudomonadota bacterium]